MNTKFFLIVTTSLLLAGMAGSLRAAEPQIVTGPSSQAIECGQSVTLTVSATGDEPLSYQWQTNGVDVTGATGTNLAISSASLAQSASYTVVVSNATSSVTSDAAVVSVADTTAPVLSVPANITVAATNAAGAVVDYTVSASDVCAGSVTPVCAPASGSTFAVGVTTVNCTANDGNGNSAPGSFSVTVNAGFTYQDADLMLVFRKAGFNDVEFNLGSISNYLGLPNMRFLSVNYDFSRVQAAYGGNLSGVRYVLMAATAATDPMLRVWLTDSASSGLPQDETGSAWTAQQGKISAVGVGATGHYYPDAVGQSLVIAPSEADSYAYIASAGGTLDVSTMGGVAPYGVEANLNGTMRMFELKVSEDSVKPFAVQTGRFRAGTDGSLSFWAGMIAPHVATQPVSKTVECGQSVTLSVTATGDEPLSYQWRTNGVDIAGATGTSLTLSSLTLAQSGNYTVVVSNAGGVDTSHAAVLSVVDTTAPSLSVPASVTLTATSSAGAVYDYTASATDVCAGSQTPVCVPASGSTFAIGATTVNCTANDGHGNNGSASFSVTVKTEFSYQDSNLLLVFSKTNETDVEFNLGNISNYLGLANGTVLNPTNYDFSRVQAAYGGDLSGVKYVLLAATASTDPTLRVWLSDSAASVVPQDETASEWTAQWNKIHEVGVMAAGYFYPDAASQLALIPSSDPGSYTYIASSGGTLDAGTMSGTAPFVVEAELGTAMRFFELKVSAATVKPFAAQVGRFTVASDGTLSFVADANIPPTALDDGAAMVRNQVLSIPDAQLLANDSDPDNDPLIILSVSATSTNGGTVVLYGNDVLYTPVNGFSGLDSFSYTISDEQGGTASANVIVFVSDAPLPAQNALTLSATADKRVVRFSGVPGRSYEMQRAPEVTGPWTTVGPRVVAPVYGIITYEDAAPLPDRGFYQMVEPKSE